MKESFFLAEVDVMNQKRVFSRGSHTEVFCKKIVLKYLVKQTGKHLRWGLSLDCRGETLKTLKKKLLYRFFPIKLLEHLFHRTPVNSLTTLTNLFNFVENIWNFGAWSNLKTYLEHIARESCFPKYFFYKWIEFIKLVY